MHGCISQAENQNLVVTEEDYINFMANAFGQDENKQLLNYMRGQVADATILFVGYGLADWNFRVIFKVTAERKRKQSYAVQFDDPKKRKEGSINQARWEAIVDFWGKKYVDIVNADATAFMKDLLDVLKQTTGVASGKH